MPQVKTSHNVFLTSYPASQADGVSHGARVFDHGACLYMSWSHVMLTMMSPPFPSCRVFQITAVVIRHVSSMHDRHQ